jgi:CelD/BcsL family acetyltransferase involved in cellulose biosynthesis
VALRSRSVWHWWYPAYEPRFARWSPGLLLDLEMAAAAGSLGLRRVDLGRASPHKARLADAARPAARGEVPAAGA